MKTTSNAPLRWLATIASTAALGGMACGPALAANVTMPKEGRFDFNYCMAGDVTLHAISDQLNMASFKLDAAMHSNIANGPFDLQGSHCVGHGWTIEGKWGDTGFCKQVDADGDLWLFRYESGPDASGKWVAIGGTGKYDGMKASGQYQAIGFPPAVEAGHFNRCNRNTGTYKLK